MSDAQREMTLHSNGVKKALHEAVQAIYLDDSSDFLSALWQIVQALDPHVHALLKESPYQAFGYTEFALRTRSTDDLETCTRHSCKRKEALRTRSGDVEQWTDEQCIEFASVAFRHAPKNLPDGVTLQDIRLGVCRATRLAKAEGDA